MTAPPLKCYLARHVKAHSAKNEAVTPSIPHT